MKTFGFNIYQIIIALVSALMIFASFKKIMKGEARQTFMKFFMTVFVWVGILTFSLFPGLANEISKRSGMGENLNTLIFLAIVVIFIIQFRTLNITEKLEQSISELVREEALKNIRTKNLDKGSNNQPVETKE